MPLALFVSRLVIIFVIGLLLGYGYGLYEQGQRDPWDVGPEAREESWRL